MEPGCKLRSSDSTAQFSLRERPGGRDRILLDEEEVTGQRDAGRVFLGKGRA